MFTKNRLLQYGFNESGSKLNARKVQSIINYFNYKKFNQSIYKLQDINLLPDSSRSSHPGFLDKNKLIGTCKFRLIPIANSSSGITTLALYDTGECFGFWEETQWWWNPDGDACNCNGDEFYVYSTYRYITVCFDGGGGGYGGLGFIDSGGTPTIPPGGSGGSGSSGGFTADEIESGASDSDPSNVWWDDNTSDPNTIYTPQPKPKWVDVYANYPKDAGGGDMPVDKVCMLIGGDIYAEYKKGNIENACALRVSRALNYSGINIPAISGQTKQGADGKNYFLLASQLKNWLVKTLGAPDIHKTAADGAPNGTNFYNLLIGINNRGIYIMKPISETSFGASGHATLWVGLDCVGQHNYFGAASDIFIWTLPQ